MPRPLESTTPSGSRADTRLALLVLFALGTVTHLFRLTTPHVVVFDEVYFGRFATAYCCTHDNIFDIHPPHAKLIIAALAKLGGYVGDFPFKHINQSYGDSPLFALRLGPAIAGILLPPTFFVLLRLLGASVAAALMGGLFVLFDNGLTVQTRVIALDGFLLLFTLLSLCAVLAAPRCRRAGMRCMLFAAAGASAGWAVGTKYTGLVAPALVMLVLMVRALRRPFGPSIGREARNALWVVAGGIGAYVGGWVLHFALLTRPGFGDAYYQLTYDFAKDFVGLQKTMLTANAGLRVAHPYGSPWWAWPMMRYPTLYWQHTDSILFFLGNPVVWWGSTLLFVVMLGHLALRAAKRRLNASAPLQWLPIVGFFLSFLPCIPIQRVLFLYHYLPSLLFSLASVGLWLDDIRWIRPGGLQAQRWSYYLTIVTLVVGFLLVSPLTFGFPASPLHGALLSGLLARP